MDQNALLLRLLCESHEKLGAERATREGAEREAYLSKRLVSTSEELDRAHTLHEQVRAQVDRLLHLWPAATLDLSVERIVDAYLQSRKELDENEKVFAVLTSLMHQMNQAADGWTTLQQYRKGFSHIRRHIADALKELRT